MSLKDNFKYTLAGLAVTGLSLLSLQTVIIPILSIVPLGYPLELLFGAILHSSNYHTIGPPMLLSIIVIFVLSVILFLRYFKKREAAENPISQIVFILFLVMEMVIVHPLFFYLDTAKDWSRAADGQFIMGIQTTYPFSSFFFLCFGILADVLRNYCRKK